MALTLYRTSKHSRLYRGVTAKGELAGFSKSSIAPMHYESVIGSGDYDTKIDTTCVRVTRADLDGYEMTSAGWHFRLQTEPATGTQKPQGTVGFGGRQGEHWFYFRLSNLGYIHWPTRDITSLGGAPDYSEAPTVNNRPRNLGSHPEVDDDMVSSNTLIRWGNIWTTPDDGELYIKWGVKQGKIKEEVVINQAAREWLAANNPPTTPNNETWFGFRFELDVSDIPKVIRDGVQQDMDTDDFDDDDGGITLNNALDELIAFMPLDEVYVGKKGGRRPLRKRFYRSGGQNYLVVAAKIDDIAALLPGDLKFDPSMTQEQVAASADDTFQNTITSYGVPDHENHYTTQTSIAAGRYDFLYPPLVGGFEYKAGFRFTPDVPLNAKFDEGGSTYATLQLYRDEYAITGNVPTDIDTLADVKSGNQPAFADNLVDSPAPGSNWEDGIAITNNYFPNPTSAGDPFAPIDVSRQMTEICSLPDWVSGNGMRLRCRSNPRAQFPRHGYDFDYAAIWVESYDGIAGSAAILDAYYVAGTPIELRHNDRSLQFKKAGKRHNKLWARHIDDTNRHKS